MTSDIVKRQRTVAQTKQAELKWQRTIPPALLNGTVLHMFDDDSCELNAMTRVDEFGFYLSWKADGKEGRSIDVNYIKEIRFGGVPKDSKTMNEIESTKGSGPIEVRSFMVVSGSELVNVTVAHFVARNSDGCKEWMEGLQSLLGNVKSWHISPLMYLKKYWINLTTLVNAEGNVVVKNLHKLFGSSKSEKQIEQVLTELGLASKRSDDIPKDSFTFEIFHQLYLKMCPRTDVEAVFKQISQGKEYIKMDQLMNYLNNEMRDPRLNELLYPLAKKDTVKKMIETLEKDEKYRQMEVLSCEGFYNFCMSDENAIIFIEHLDITQDVDQPLSHYYASSSHNTYLVGRQFGGKSSVDIYRYVLIAGCRCIEIDAWDGKGEDQEPIVTHGKAMTTEVLLKDVIQAIKETAFLASDYPVVISIENHLNKVQQYKMAKYFEEILGDLLLKKQLDGWSLEPGLPLPPPYLLKNKILLKNKRLKPEVEQEQLELFLKGQEFSTEAEENQPPDDPNAAPVPPADVAAAPAAGQPGATDDAALAAMAAARHVGSTLAVHPYLSQMINYVQAVKFVGFDVSEEQNRAFHISSFSEVVGLGLMKQSATEFVNYNKRQLSRIYPKGNRVDSSNYMPQVFWNAGCQYVALNFQTPDLSMQLNQGKFEYQGGCGYILKPDFMRRPDRAFDPFSESPVDGVIAASMKIQILSGYFLTDKKIGTYVEVEMYGLPTDTIRKEHRTKVVSQNGLNPVYNEEPFVFRKIVLPDMAVLRFAVFDETGRLIGQRVIPFESMRAGYRHVHLRNEYNYPLPLAMLFIKAEIKSYVPEGMANFVDALSDPKAFMSQAEKRVKAMASMGIDEGDIMHDDPLTKKKAAEVNKKPVAKVGPQQQGPGAASERDPNQAADKNDTERNTPATLRETKQLLRLRRTHAKEMENMRKAQQKERIEMHRLHCQKIDKLVIAVEKTRQAEERKAKGKLSSSVSMPNLTSAGKGGASTAPADLDSFINQQTAEIRSLVEEQTKEWTQLVLSQLEKDYELRKLHVTQEYDLMRTIIGPVQALQLKNIQAKHLQEQKDLKSQQAKVSVETAKQMAADKSISNRAERDRRLRETNENNTKKFVDERKRQAMKQSQQMEKLKKTHEEEIKDLQKEQDHDLALLKNSYEEARLATKTETVI